MLSTSSMRIVKTSLLISTIILITLYATSNHLTTNITSFCTLVRKLQQQGVLDGEVCVIKNGNVIVHELSESVAINNPNGQSQFLIGSLSKQFTAAALLHALYSSSEGRSETEKCSFVEQQLHRPLSDFLSAEAPIWNGSMPLWADQITLHHLLSHTAGISNTLKTIFDNEGFDGVREWLSTPHTAAQIIALSIQEPLAFEPGTNYAYSNEGYTLLTEVIAAISGMPFAQYIENLCHSIGMSETYHPHQGNWKNIKKQQTTSLLLPELVYSVIDKRAPLREPAPIMWDDISNALGAGGIVSTVQDLIKWNTALHKTHVILHQQLYELLIKPNLKNYGYGIQNKNGIVTHNGEFDSFSSKMVYIPKEDIIIIALFHINCDETIKKTIYLLEQTLTKTIPIESERKQLVNKISAELDQQYPATRGAASVKNFQIK